MRERRSSPVPALIAATLVAQCILISHVARANDYFVNPTGAGGAFTTIQSAINAVPAGTAGNRTNIFIAPGVYTETTGPNSNLSINKAFVSLIGQGAAPGDVVIQNGVGGLTGATRLQSSASDFLATNLTFKSTVGDNNGVVRRQTLQARSQVRSRSVDRPLARRSFANGFSDNDQAGSDADAHLQRFARRQDELAHFRREIEQPLQYENFRD